MTDDLKAVQAYFDREMPQMHKALALFVQAAQIHALVEGRKTCHRQVDADRLDRLYLLTTDKDLSDEAFRINVHLILGLPQR